MTNMTDLQEWDKVQDRKGFKVNQNKSNAGLSELCILMNKISSFSE